jgi:hypothetical protein
VTTTVAAATAATAAATTEIRCESIGGVSDFFDVPAPPEPPPEPRHRLPPWLGPPRGELPGVVPFELVLARTERVAVCLAALRAYSTGFLVDLVTLSAEDDEALDPELFPHHRRGRPTEGLRFGLEFADGRRATNLGLPPGGRSESPDGPGAPSARRWRRRRPVAPGAVGLAASATRLAGVRLRVAGGRGSRSRGPRSTRGRSSTRQHERR